MTEEAAFGNSTSFVVGIILAGGEATRLGGGDKGLVALGGVPILARVVAALGPQCDRLVLNANGPAARFASSGLPVVADGLDGRLGPLAGLLAGLDWVAAHAPKASHAVTAPTDAPFLPPDLVERFVAARDAAASPPAIVCAGSGGKTHYVIALWRVGLRHDLRRALEEGVRGVRRFLDRHAWQVVEWPIAPIDPFANINTPADLATAAAALAGLDREA